MTYEEKQTQISFEFFFHDKLVRIHFVCEVCEAEKWKVFSIRQRSQRVMVHLPGSSWREQQSVSHGAKEDLRLSQITGVYISSKMMTAAGCWSVQSISQTEQMKEKLVHHLIRVEVTWLFTIRSAGRAGRTINEVLQIRCWNRVVPEMTLHSGSDENILRHRM